jgi:hypothetical protein
MRPSTRAPVAPKMIASSNRMMMSVICPRLHAMSGFATGGGIAKTSGGRYWDRTSDLFRVREARYRCANRPCEVETGFEPVWTALQAADYPLGHSTKGSTNTDTPSGRRDSNPRPSPWQGDALPLRHVRVPELALRPGTDNSPVRCQPPTYERARAASWGTPTAGGPLALKT